MKIIEEFIEEVIKEIKRKNKGREFNEKKLLDIPFIIAPMYQNLSEKKYQSFLDDLEHYEYTVSYEQWDSEGYIISYIDVALQQISNYSYRIEFSETSIPNWYCECTPKDKGYVESKKCCGYNCDWYAPTFKINKLVYVGNDKWNGKAHEYWDFENNFYRLEETLIKGKETRDRNKKD